MLHTDQQSCDWSMTFQQGKFLMCGPSCGQPHHQAWRRFGHLFTNWGAFCAWSLWWPVTSKWHEWLQCVTDNLCCAPNLNLLATLCSWDSSRLAQTNGQTGSNT